MGRFKRQSSADWVRADWWDKGVDPTNGEEWKEEVLLRPILSRDLQQKAAKAALKPPANVTMEDFQNASPIQMLMWTDQSLMEKTLMLGMIKAWKFRYEPTPEQETAGLPGDLRECSEESLSELSDEDVQFIMEEINKRSKSVRREAEEAKPGFQPEVSDNANSEGDGQL